MAILSNAERLEEITQVWEMVKEIDEKKRDLHPEFKMHINWLIEQAQRVEETEKYCEVVSGHADFYLKRSKTMDYKNIRLKEALTFYADEISYKDYDEWSPGTSDVMSDHGRKAKSALEETK